MLRRRRKNVDDEPEVKADFTPMIDLIFLLLVFFILTTKFIPEEQMIGALLPNKGSDPNPKPTIDEPPQHIQVRVYPATMTTGMNVAQLDQLWHEARPNQKVRIRIGNTDAGLLLDGQALSSPDGAANHAALGAIHRYVAQHLANNEIAGVDRSKQMPVEIHAFSGLSWKFALSSFDAVRDYEDQRFAGDVDEADAMATAREVHFARQICVGARRLKWDRSCIASSIIDAMLRTKIACGLE